MLLKQLNAKTLNAAIRLKIECWQEELAGKVIHSLDFEETYAFWHEWMGCGKAHDDVRTLLGYFDDDKLVATIFASFAETEDHDNAVEINGLFVEKAYRGQNLSLKLLYEVLTNYQQLGKEAVIVYNHKYAPSNSFYKHFGGTIIKEVTQLSGALIVEVFYFDLNNLLTRIKEKIQ